MRHVSVCIAASLAVSVPTPCALLHAQGTATADSSTVITTSGTGEISLVPDHGVLRFEVRARDRTASQAAAANRRVVQQVVDTLTTVCGPSDTVQVIRVSVGPTEDYQARRTVGYHAEATVRVVLRDMEQLAPTMDAALAAGAYMGGVQFRSIRAEAGQHDALAAAYHDALGKAAALAEAAGTVLGPLVSLSTLRPGSQYPSPVAEIRVQSPTASLTPSDVVVRAVVYATWRVLPSNVR